MADGAQEVAVGRAGKEVEIIPATLQRSNLHQSWQAPGSGPPTPHTQVFGWVGTPHENSLHVEDSHEGQGFPRTTNP